MPVSMNRQLDNLSLTISRVLIRLTRQSEPDSLHCTSTDSGLIKNRLKCNVSQLWKDVFEAYPDLYDGLECLAQKNILLNRVL